ncbi:DUF3311 domain-containing protein [Halococcoides cellulosivorans]|uniref:DUF3311 domain-containing protein n=1 Tax=Halococcoides cellulosivorans TaxID=1679096 RepID=A0A2R4X460_9EURY|nr:DUF3311 domain-containing protein [Halococcoides cellulosivorans]AWB28586.1 hypothetical protein HARCEL1_01385 [Halococcoides cellulosivorans]
MTDRTRIALWGGVAVVLAALAVPWFLWRSDTVVAALPVWIWWHIVWMALTALVFWTFTRRAWGLGIVELDAETPDPDGADERPYGGEP